MGPGSRQTPKRTRLEVRKPRPDESVGCRSPAAGHGTVSSGRRGDTYKGLKGAYAYIYIHIVRESRLWVRPGGRKAKGMGSNKFD